MKSVIFSLLFLLGSCHDNLTLNQVVYYQDIRYKVTIEGHVKQPGLYLLNKNDSIRSLIAKAGGYQENAQLLEDNLVIKDNLVLFVNSNRIKNKININNCSTSELTKIKGIGPKLALKIVEYRQKYGDYQALSELMNVKGIKDKLFKKIYEYLKV